MIFPPFSRLYGAIANLRNTLYEKGFFKSFSLGAPAISIGNLTVGGTGKTPLVAFVAEILAEEGAKVCVLTRGYKRENPRTRVLVSDGEKILADVKEAGDEPFELARKLLGKGMVVADANRVAAANWARENFGATAFVLDDAFQHRQAKRDLDIVLVDATNPFGNSETLPSGILREPLTNLKRADLIVITRANLVGEKEITNYKLQITKFNPDCPIFTAENKISNLIELEKFNVEPEEFNAKTQRRQDAKKNYPQMNTDELGFEENQKLGTWNLKLGTRNSELGTRKALAFCALGNPDNFFEQLKRENFNLVSTQKFPDHHFYKQTDIEKLEKQAAQTQAEILLTTAKDAVKLSDLNFEMPCFVVENKLVFDDEKKLREIIKSSEFQL